MQIFLLIFNVTIFDQWILFFIANPFAGLTGIKSRAGSVVPFWFLGVQDVFVSDKKPLCSFLSATHNLALHFHLRSYGERVRDSGSSQLTPFLKAYPVFLNYNAFLFSISVITRFPKNQFGIRGSQRTSSQ